MNTTKIIHAPEWRAALSRMLLALSTTALSLPVASPAQSAPASSPRASEETVVMSPFEVTTDTDVGYTASNSLMGGRTNMLLKDTPAAVSVITRQFLDDIAAIDPASVVEWTVNIAPNYESNTAGFSTYNYNIRNLGTSYASRNYFLWYGYSDDYNIDRYEFARGPNGTVYGDANVGGIPTTWSKRAQFGRQKTVVAARADTFGGWRTTLDYTQPLNDRVAIRLNLVHDNKADWYDVVPTKMDGVAFSGVYRATKNDTVRVAAEKGHYVKPIFSHNYSDNASFWNGTTVYSGGAALSTTSGFGIARDSTAANLVYIPGAANGGLNDMSTYYTTNGSNVKIWPIARSDIPNFPVLPSRDFVLQPRSSLSDVQSYYISAALEHRFNDNLTAELAFNRHITKRNNDKSSQNTYQNYKIDINTILPGGAPNPHFREPYDQLAVNHPVNDNNVTEVRALAAWRFTARWLKQNFTGLVGSRMDIFNNAQSRLTRTNGTNTNLSSAANIVLVRRYWSQAGEPVTDIPPIPGVTIEMVPQSEQHSRKSVDYGQLASTSRFFNDRLTVMAGVRYDRIQSSDIQTTNISLTANGLPQLGSVILVPGTTISAPTVGAKLRTDRGAVSQNLGAVYFFLPWVGVFANYAESVAATTAGASLLDGTIPEMVRNSGKDVGLRLNLLDGRIAGSISFYQNRQSGAIQTSNLFISNITQIWSDLGRDDRATLDYRDTQDKSGQGWEVEITANPTRHLRLMWNFALPRSTIINIRPSLTKYYAENLAEWQAGANNPSNPNRGRIQSNITTIAAFLATLTPGATVNDTYKYQSNIYATYSFDRGFLKNFSVGGGVNLRGRNKVDALVTNPYQYLYAPAYYVATGQLTYRHRFANKLNARFQLNITNLLDNQDLVFSPQAVAAYTTYRVQNLASNPLIQVPSGMRQQDPRKFVLSTTFDY